MTKRNGIYIDSWKFEIFKKTFDDAGITFKKKPGLVSKTWCLVVMSDDTVGLAMIVKSANDECARVKAEGESRGETKH